MFSRYDRDSLIAVINRYLSEDLTAFKFDEQLSEIAAKTTDETVKFVANLFWGFYDDVEDHKIVASKEEWDLFQRLILILKSDADVLETGKRIWTARQYVAGVCLVIFAVAVGKTGYGDHLFLVTAPLGCVSMALSYWRSRVEECRLRDQAAITPFGSLSELRALRRKIKNFAKARYPARIGSRQIRGPVSAGVMWLQFGVLWLLFSPVALAFQVLPEPEQNWKVTGG
jgi:hypothetical protein